MVVEEVNTDEEKIETPETEMQTPNEGGHLDEVKEKVEDLQGVTEDLSEDVQKAEEVQEEIAQAVEEAEKPTKHEDISHEQQEVPDQFPPLNKPSGTNPLVVIIPGIFLLGALLGGIYFYQRGINLPSNPEPTPTESAVATPAPTEAPATVDLTKYPVHVMNGSGITGEAAKVKAVLEGGGFKVSTIGNASSSDFTKTVIKVKSDVPASFVSQLSTLLSKTYLLDTNQTLATSSADKVQVIVGSSKAK